MVKGAIDHPLYIVVSGLAFYLVKPDDIASPKKQPHVSWELMPQFMKALYKLDEPSEASRPDAQCLVTSSAEP